MKNLPLKAVGLLNLENALVVKETRGWLILIERIDPSWCRIKEEVCFPVNDSNMLPSLDECDAVSVSYTGEGAFVIDSANLRNQSRSRHSAEVIRVHHSFFIGEAITTLDLIISDKEFIGCPCGLCPMSDIVIRESKALVQICHM